MRIDTRSFIVMGALVATVSCNGDGPTNPPPVTTPPTTIAQQPSPTPTPAPTPTPTAQECTFEPGPVARLAISPRGDSFRSDGSPADIWVRARPNWDEVVCLDKDKTHRLDFNANQRNAAGRECCYEGEVSWAVDDGSGLIASHQRRPDNTDGFIYRFNIEPRGREGAFSVEASLDGILSHPWQSQSGYRREPLRVLTMSAADIARDCNCIYRGNGVYEGPRCPK